MKNWNLKFKTKFSGWIGRDTSLDEEIVTIEELLLQSDVGVNATNQICRYLKSSSYSNKVELYQNLSQFLYQQLLKLELAYPKIIDKKSTVWIILGVNGVGKTTSIAKIANHYANEGKSILLTAADTFRAAAVEQLNNWAIKNNIPFFGKENAPPASVVFDALTKAKKELTDLVLIDTAGRLPTQISLIEELKKIYRICGKVIDSAPDECLLVLDANTGQNMLHQIKLFNEALNITGLVVTKLDGSAKAGAIIAMLFDPAIRTVPIYFIGVGEGVDDLYTFNAKRFVDAFIPYENLG